MREVALERDLAAGSRLIEIRSWIAIRDSRRECRLLAPASSRCVAVSGGDEVIRPERSRPR